MSIIDLQEVAADVWQAKYHGNYGIYKIKIKINGKEVKDFSCSCPSDRYPCKHIAMVKEAVDERIAKGKRNKDDEITVDQLLQDVPLNVLRDFVVTQAKYNAELKKAVFLEFFAERTTGKNADYNRIIREALSDLYFDEEDLYHAQYNDDAIDLEDLWKWLDKAQEYIKKNNAPEAVLICKACIEEYASWLKDQGDYFIDYVNPDYKERMFGLLEEALPMEGVNKEELLRYCKTEMKQPQYQAADMYDNFNDLLMILAKTEGAADFISFQDKLLSAIPDKSSWDAQKILTRKIEFYRTNGEPGKAWEVIRENLQIESFRYARNTGRNIYEQIKMSLYLMLEISGGINVVKDMINNYRILYKRRKAMMEMLMDIRI